MEHLFVVKPVQRPSIGHFPNWSLPAYASRSHFNFASVLDQGCLWYQFQIGLMEHLFVVKPVQRPSIGHFPNWSLPAFASWSHFDFAAKLDQRQMLHQLHSSTWASVHGSTLLIFVPWLLVPRNILNFPNISSSTLELWFWTRFSDVPLLWLLWWIYHCHGEKLINSFYSQ